ncbi:hypothetical protein [Grimontia sp. NTOU-MAR1]|uniref:hypothetical protein n=1 Tax=Grimontia sp. NTOU-MAR1 TaxID=3111011 RepID=UPI002DB75D98|nr:hypothetical protein [Grimontia sp. NTOU-MAR1]WRW00266.1 hypothetical protein VP504_25140 [Grimontia sp. NTOU-MAR1]
MKYKKSTLLSLVISASLTLPIGFTYASSINSDSETIRNAIETLQNSESNSTLKLFENYQTTFRFDKIDIPNYHNAIAVYQNGQVTVDKHKIKAPNTLQSVLIHEQIHARHPELTEYQVDEFAALYAQQAGINYVPQNSFDPIPYDDIRPSIPNIFKNNLVGGLCRSGLGGALTAVGAFGAVGLAHDIYNEYVGGTAISQEVFNAAAGLAVPFSWALFDYVLGRAQWVHGFPGSHASDGQRINDALRSIPRVGNVIANTLNLGAFSERTLREELGLMMFIGSIGTNAIIQRVADQQNHTAAAWPLKIVDTAIWGSMNGMIGEFVRYKNGGTYNALTSQYPEGLIPYLGAQKWSLLTSSINCGLAAFAGNQAWGKAWVPVDKNSTMSEYASSAYGAAAAYMGTWIAVDGVFKSMQYAISAGVPGFRDVVWANFVQQGISLINLAYAVEYHPDTLPAETDYGEIPEVTIHMRKKRSTGGSIDPRIARMRKIFHELNISRSEAIAAWERATASPLDLNNWQKVQVTRLEQDLALENSPQTTNASGISTLTLAQLKEKQLSHLAKEAKTVTKVTTQNYADWRAWWNASAWERPAFCLKDGVLEYGQWLSNGGNITEQNCGINSYGDGANGALRFNDGSMAIGINGRTIKSGEAWTVGSNGGSDWSGYYGYAFFDSQGRPTAMAITSKNWARHGAGFSFLYKNGSWEYWKTDGWISEFPNGNSLDLNAPRFSIPAQ